MKYKFLFLGMGGNVTQGIFKALKNSKLDFVSYGACVSNESIGLYWCDKAIISPFAADENFIFWLIEICNKEKIDMIFTGVEENIITIAKNYELFESKCSTKFIHAGINNLNIGQDKLLTVKWLKENNLSYPEFAEANNKFEVENLISKVGFPLIAKPRKGKGSNGIKIINNYADIEDLEKFNNYVFQELIGDSNTEYTVGCYTSKNGIPVNPIIMHRQLKYGTTFKAEVIQDDDILKEANKICKAFKLKGPLNIQLRKNNLNIPITFELNVRFSGTTPIRAHFGFNDVEAMVKEYVLNESIDSCFNIRTGIAYRYFDEIYFDADSKMRLNSINFNEINTKFNIKIQ